MTTINNPKNNNPPYFPGAQYNPTINNSGGTASTQSLVNQLTPYFLKFPSAQGQEFLSDVIVNGDLIISDTNNQFVSNIDLSMKANILLDSSTNYIQFGDGTRQTTAPSPDDINTVYNDISNTFTSPTIQTFQGSNNSTTISAPLQFSNIDTGEFGGLFVDPNPNTDLTLYSNQNIGGLTVSNINGYSFTVNPTIGNVANFKNPISSDFDISGASLNVNNTVIFANSESTAISNTSLESTNPNIYFALNDPSNNQVAPLQIYYNSIQYNANLNMNNNPIYNISSLQIGTGTNTYTQLIQGGSTFGINNLYPSSLSPQISIAVKNLSETLQGLTVTSSGVNLNTQLNMANYNIINLGSGSTAVTQSSSTNNSTIATTAFVQNLFANMFSGQLNASVSNISGFNFNPPTIFNFVQNYNGNTKSNNLYLQDLNDVSIGIYTPISFTLTFPSNLYPTGTTPIFLTGTFINLYSPDTLQSLNLQVSFLNNTQIRCTSGGSQTNSTTANFSGQFFISWA